MSMIYLSLGSNIDDRYGNLRMAVRSLQEKVTITAQSPVFATEPWGFTDQAPFFNICIAGHTDLSPRELLSFLKSIEQDMGRLPSGRWGPRLIDIDILFYDVLISNEPDLIIPHPYLTERAFVLAPLATIAPNLAHPVTHETVQEMLAKVDSVGVDRLSDMPLIE